MPVRDGRTVFDVPPAVTINDPQHFVQSVARSFVRVSSVKRTMNIRTMVLLWGTVVTSDSQTVGSN